MACRKEALRAERKNRNAAAAAAVSDALLFTTMCIIGMPVDVYAKDGSVYSGIFHTASVDKDYAIVLKKASTIKKGNLDANVVNGTLIETLIVRSEDLVQVVAKGVQIPTNGINGCVWGDDLEAAAVYTNAEVGKPNEHKSESRQVGDGSLQIQSNCHSNTEFQEKRTIDEAQGSSRSISSCEDQSTGASDTLEGTIQQEPKGVSSCHSEDQDEGVPISDETVHTVASPPTVSVPSIPNFDVISESCLSASSNPFLWVPPESSSVNKTTKESKLNPGAKNFSPSTLQHRTVVPNGASVSYMPSTYTMASMATAQEEIDSNSFTRSSLPIKFAQYNNVAFGRSGNDAPHLQPIIELVNRTQPVRYTGQYQNFQTVPGYVHPNPQNVMFGRAGSLVCMHPISGDVQTAAGLYPATPRPMLTSHQVHLPKHQGHASTQALQLRMTPTVMTNVPQPFVMPSSIPVSQPVFPLYHPMAIPGSNGFFSTKFA